MCELCRLGATEARPNFDCGDPDLNEFFHLDSIVSAKHLLNVTYTVTDSNGIVAFYCVSNDSISRDACPRSAWDRLKKPIPRQKQYSSMPAVKIGRLGVSNAIQSNGIGTWIIDIIKLSFSSDYNKTGCRFVVVDAYNKSKPIAFYERNGFKFLTGTDKKLHTRTMYYDLKTFVEHPLVP